MKQLVREGMLAGARGFSTTPKDRDDPAGVAAEEERYILGSVLGELGTGLFQVSGGSPEGVYASHRTARELSEERPSCHLQPGVPGAEQPRADGESTCSGWKTPSERGSGLWLLHIHHGRSDLQPKPESTDGHGLRE